MLAQASHRLPLGGAAVKRGSPGTPWGCQVDCRCGQGGPPQLGAGLTPSRCRGGSPGSAGGRRGLDLPPQLSRGLGGKAVDAEAPAPGACPLAPAPPSARGSVRRELCHQRLRDPAQSAPARPPRRLPWPAAAPPSRPGAHLPGGLQSPSARAAGVRGRSPGLAASAPGSQAAGPGGRAGPAPGPQQGAGSPCAEGWRTRSQVPESAARMPRALGALPAAARGAPTAGARLTAPGAAAAAGRRRAPDRGSPCGRTPGRPRPPHARSPASAPLTWGDSNSRGPASRSFRAAEGRPAAPPRLRPLLGGAQTRPKAWARRVAP